MFKKKGEAGAPAPKSARPSHLTYVPVQAAAACAVTPQEQILAGGIRNSRNTRIAGTVLAALAVAAFCAYGAGAYYYSNRFFEGTTINGQDVSGMTAYEVEKEIAARVEDYSIRVESRNYDAEVISGESIGYRYASDGQVLSALKAQNPLNWISGLWKKVSYTLPTRATYNKTLLEEELLSLQCARAENQVAPENAYVSYQDNRFEIVPETEGNELLIKEAYRALDQAISGESASINLESVPEVYTTADVKSDDPILKETLDAYNNFARASITYTFGDEKVVVDGNTIRNWLEFDEKGQLVQDEASFRQHAEDFVYSLACEYDTVGREMPFDTTSGRTVYVYNYAYGWAIDQEEETAQLMSEIRNGVTTTRDPIYYMTANSRGYSDYGGTYIEVDLSDQYMYYYRYGDIIMDSPIVSGLMSDSSRQTPSGVFTLYYKKSPEVLRGPMKDDGTYEWEANVTYWMPFNGGIGFHDATWQDYFGGDRFLYAGSHGCINLPYDSAAYLYSLIDYNVPIICFY